MPPPPGAGCPGRKRQTVRCPKRATATRCEAAAPFPLAIAAVCQHADACQLTHRAATRLTNQAARRRHGPALGQHQWRPKRRTRQARQGLQTPPARGAAALRPPSAHPHATCDADHGEVHAHVSVCAAGLMLPAVATGVHNTSDTRGTWTPSRTHMPPHSPHRMPVAMTGDPVGSTCVGRAHVCTAGLACLTPATVRLGNMV